MVAAHESVLSDALLSQLIAVGQVDVVVGLPTLNNASTVAPIARAINSCFVRDYPRLRTVMINSDAGSTDGTPELIRDAAFSEGDVVQTSHSLRTLHRVVTPYHGLPGKLNGLRTIFAAAALTQAKSVVVLDPAGPATSKERVTDLIAPIVRGEVEFLSPRHRRHPREGALVTQLMRPVVRTVYRVQLDEPLGVEFSCSQRFISHCLDQQIWQRDVARFAIDLWLRTEAIARGFSLGQVWRPAPTPATMTSLREVVRQVFLSLMVCLRSHETYWQPAADCSVPRTWGEDSRTLPNAVAWDYAALGDQARRDIGEIRPLLEEVLTPPIIARLLDANPGEPHLDDELWVRTVIAFVTTASEGRMTIDQLADMFVPVYTWRAASFTARTADDSPETAQQRLNTLCDTFERLRPTLVSQWASGK